MMCVSMWFEFLVIYFNVKTRDIWKGNLTTRSEVYTENLCSRWFQDIRKGVTLRRLILQSLEYALLVQFTVKIETHVRCRATEGTLIICCSPTISNIHVAQT